MQTAPLAQLVEQASYVQRLCPRLPLSLVLLPVIPTAVLAIKPKKKKVSRLGRCIFINESVAKLTKHMTFSLTSLLQNISQVLM